MPLRQQVFFLAIATTLFLVVFELVRRRRLRVEYSWLWLAAGASIIFMILRYDALVALTRLIGVVVPTSTILFLATLFLALVCLDYAIRLTTLSRQVKELAQEVALLKARQPKGLGE